MDLPGGIERAIANTANLLQQKGNEISILILDDTPDSFYPLNGQIKIVQEYLNFGITRKGNFFSRKIDFLKHISRLKSIIKKQKPDIILSTEYPFTIAAAIATKSTKAKLFAWEHHHFHHLPKSSFWKRLFRKFYPETTAVVCLNEDEANLYKSMGCRTAVIPNFTTAKERATLVEKTLITVGWLSHTKGTDMVPAIAEKVFREHADWHWKIIGTGDEESSLNEKLKSKGLEKFVSVTTPSTHAIDQEYLSASMYIMTSRYECFPMVLLEAMSHGLPCVAFNCPTGPKHIIEHEVNGVLVRQNDVEEIANAIIDLLSNQQKRKEFGANAYDSIRKFHPDQMYGLWQNLFAE